MSASFMTKCDKLSDSAESPPSTISLYAASAPGSPGTRYSCGYICARYGRTSFPDTISEVVLAPNQFYYSENFPTVDDFGRDLISLAEDVIARWEREKAGETDVGRVLPPEYFYYGALNNRNWFRTDYYDLSTKWYYEWDSPYES